MLPNRPIKFIEKAAALAITQAKKSTYRYRLGSVVLNHNVIVGKGHNTKSTHPLANTPYKTVHAEFSAILNSQSKDIDVLYVCRIKRNNECSISKPCNDCMMVIRSTGIKYIWYTERTGVWRLIELN